jgi:hypothetical protein
LGKYIYEGGEREKVKEKKVGGDSLSSHVTSSARRCRRCCAPHRKKKTRLNFSFLLFYIVSELSLSLIYISLIPFPLAAAKKERKKRLLYEKEEEEGETL